ncbi:MULTISPECIES: epoxide hydrolase family protein [unclassified Pseudomonas]|uniref:epoxide hydrolase family protein n=1 Tax=unclassified Pseudomonas TaxID=196821 RepID=UPI0025FDEF11|nr:MULTISPECIES: epoxide hydrolase family protein [unclassified Pseudomonas]
MQAFEVQWTEESVNRLLHRIADTPLPEAPISDGWKHGCDANFLAGFRDYWVNDFDWRACVAALNRHPQFIARVEGLDVHFVHVQGENQGRRPLLLTHGWPGSYIEFWNVIEPLAFPSRHGGRPEDAFDLVIPSLPGFGFSGKPGQVVGQRQTARMWNTLMTEVLGYPCYCAQGGDWGAIVTSWLGLDFPDSVQAIHLNMLGLRSLAPPGTDEERDWQRRVEGAQRVYSGYSAVQMFKPQSLVWATAGNPLGQAAWILERFHDWADLRQRPFEQVFDRDTLLANLMIYLMTDSFASSIWYYPGVVNDGFGILPDGVRCETPTWFARYHGDSLAPAAPRSRVERVYNLSQVSDIDEGGHFAALEVPQRFVADLHRWSEHMRNGLPAGLSGN